MVLHDNFKLLNLIRRIINKVSVTIFPVVILPVYAISHVSSFLKNLHNFPSRYALKPLSPSQRVCSCAFSPSSYPSLPQASHYYKNSILFEAVFTSSSSPIVMLYVFIRALLMASASPAFNRTWCRWRSITISMTSESTLFNHVLCCATGHCGRVRLS